MNVPAVHEYGPYTLYDLDALPEDGKRYELADGWLTELFPSPWHDPAADRLKDILKNAARLAGAQVYVAGGPNDITTPAGVRKPASSSSPATSHAPPSAGKSAPTTPATCSWSPR